MALISAIAAILVATCSSFMLERRGVITRNGSLFVGAPLVETSQAPIIDRIDPQVATKHHLMLVSVPFPKNATSDTLLNDIWKWKESNLGDGANHLVGRRQRRRRRVEFIPRSEAIRLFQSTFVGVGIEVEVCNDFDDEEKVLLKLTNGSNMHILLDNKTNSVATAKFNGNTSFEIEECSVLSTCARFDFILVLCQRIQASKFSEEDSCRILDLATKNIVAHNLRRQTKLMGLHDVANQFRTLYGAETISNHLCLVAGGLTARPDLPNSREVNFQPFSSQDSHIMMQLKRAVEIISTVEDLESQETKRGKRPNRKAKKRRDPSGTRKRTKKVGSPGRGRIKTLLDGALRAGKAARNEAVLPEISQLKRHSEDCSTSPGELLDTVIEVSVSGIVCEVGSNDFKAAIEKAIRPNVESVTKKLSVLDSAVSNDVASIRRRVAKYGEEISSNDDAIVKAKLKKVANQLLHEPTMRLRIGSLPDNELDGVVASIENKLNKKAEELRHKLK